MSYTPLFTDRFWRATIHWTKPIAYEQARDNRAIVDGTAHFYMILERAKKSTRLLYIGKTYRSEVWLRLKNHDHQKRLKKMKQTFRDCKLEVSHGVLNLKLWKKLCSERYPTAKRIDEIESMLIYSNHLEGVNARKHRAHGITDHYMITNKGNYKPLKRQVLLSIFEKH